MLLKAFYCLCALYSVFLAVMVALGKFNPHPYTVAVVYALNALVFVSFAFNTKR